MKLLVAIFALVVLSLWMQCSATAPAQPAVASFADHGDRHPFRREDTPDTDKQQPPSKNGGDHPGIAETQKVRVNPPTTSSPVAMQRMQQKVLKDMFHMDALPEEDRLETDKESNYMLALYNEVADNHTGVLRPRRGGKPTVLTEKVRSLPVRGKPEIPYSVCSHCTVSCLVHCHCWL